MPHSIAALASNGDRTFAAVGDEVRVYTRGKEEKVIGCGAGKVAMLFVFGKLLLAYTAQGVVVLINVETLEEEARMDLREAGESLVTWGSHAAIHQWAPSCCTE